VEPAAASAEDAPVQALQRLPSALSRGSDVTISGADPKLKCQQSINHSSAFVRIRLFDLTKIMLVFITKFA
jgi:hypothetical protein